LDPLDAIHEAVALHAGWLEEARLKGNADGTVQRWTRRMHALQQAAQELHAFRAREAAPQTPAESADAQDNLSDLPPALLAQLSGPKTDRLEGQILDVLRSVGGLVELNRLLIELYRRHGDVHERKALNNKAYRMVQKGLIRQAPDRRGVYGLQSA
jgi:hypothetical protein